MKNTQKRNSNHLARLVGAVSQSLVGTAMLACAALAVIDRPVIAAHAPARAVEVVRLEGLVVTPARNYSASEWRRRQVQTAALPAGPAPVARLCKLPVPEARTRTQTC